MRRAREANSVRRSSPDGEMREEKREKREVGEKPYERRRPGAVAAIAAAVLALLSGWILRSPAQDTTAKYPWRVSNFPYVTASPNDGLMGLGRVVFFRQSRWDDRISLTDEVAIEGGYSTKDAWLAHVKGDFPRLAPGWRLQAKAEASREPNYDASIPVHRQLATVEITRRIQGPLLI